MSDDREFNLIFGVHIALCAALILLIAISVW